jgi:phenylalanine-4-hydroxylase
LYYSPSPDCNGKLFVKAVLVFLVAAERPEEAPAGTLEKQTGLQKLAMKSGK